MFDKEEEKKVVSMDMGGEIKPVKLPVEEEKAEEVKVERSTEVPQLMQIGPELKEDVPPIVETPTEVEPPKPKPKPVPTIGEIPPKPVEVKEEPKVEIKDEVKEEPKVVKQEPVIAPKPTVKPEPSINPVYPVSKPSPAIETDKINKEDIEKTMVMPKVEEKEAPLEIGDVKVEKEEVKEEEEKIEAGPNVISEPLATEDTKKEKKKNPHFFECPPECIPIKPIGYIFLNILYMIPIIGLIMILAHSASYKNLNRRNYARSYLIVILLIIILLAAAIYFLKIDVIKIIENITGYKIDLQHFKFTKFK